MSATDHLEKLMLGLPVDELMPIIKSQVRKPNFRPAYESASNLDVVNMDTAVFMVCMRGIFRITQACTEDVHPILAADANFVVNHLIKWLVTLMVEMPSYISHDERLGKQRGLYLHLLALMIDPNIPPLIGASSFVVQCTSGLVHAFLHQEHESDFYDICNILPFLVQDPTTRLHMCTALRCQSSRLLYTPINRLEKVANMLKANPGMTPPVQHVMRDLIHAGTIGFVDAELRESLWKRNVLSSVVTIFHRFLDHFDLPTSGTDRRSNINRFLRVLVSLHDSRADVTMHLRAAGWIQSLDAGLLEVAAKAVRVFGNQTVGVSDWLQYLLVDMSIYTICSRKVAVRTCRGLARIVVENMDGMGRSRMTDDSTPLKWSWLSFVDIVQKVTRLDPQTNAVSLICMNPKCDNSFSFDYGFKRCSRCYAFIVCSKQCWREVGVKKLHTKEMCQDAVHDIPHTEVWYPEFNTSFWES